MTWLDRVADDLRQQISTLRAAIAANTKNITALQSGASGITQATADARYVPRWQANTTYTAGQAVVLPNGRLYTRLSNGTSGATVDYLQWSRVGADPMMRSGAIAESVVRSRLAGNGAALVSGQETLVAVTLHAGQVISKITWLSGSTAGASLTHQIFTLRDSSFGLLAQTSDDTSTAWAGSSEKQLTLASAYTVPADGLYYIGVLVTASTVPTLKSASPDTQANALAPRLSAISSATGLTAPPQTCTPASGGFSFLPYAWLS